MKPDLITRARKALEVPKYDTQLLREYVDGMETEHARTAKLVEALLECVETCLGSYECCDSYSKPTEKLKMALEEMESGK